jgi:hypothetical protein
MNPGIHISKKGFRLIEWSDDKQDYVETTPKFIYYYLKDTCYINEDVTLKDIIELVGRGDCGESLLLRGLIDCCSTCTVLDFVDEAKLPAENPIESGYIELEKCLEFHINHQGKLKLDEYFSVGGRGADGERWGIDFLGVNDIGHLPVRLNPNCRVISFNLIDSGSTLKEVSVPTTFSLFEVISEIFWEISFNGSPKERKKRVEELLSAVKEIEDGRGEVKTKLEAQDDESNIH